jgi:hypothetical protein
MSREGEPSDMNRPGIEIDENDAAGMNTAVEVFATFAALESSPDQSRETD